jgi:uncharacterized membrane protein
VWAAGPHPAARAGRDNGRVSASDPGSAPGPPARRGASRVAGLERVLAGAAAHPGEHLPAWLRPTRGEPRWPAALAVLCAIGLQLLVGGGMALRPYWLLPSLEFALLAVVVAMNPNRVNRESDVLRRFGLALVAVASLATAWSVLRLVWDLTHGRGSDQPIALLATGGAIWLTNVIVFALWYWEVDGGGPARRANTAHRYPAFLFPQMTTPELTRPEWEPSFVDYFYVSFTNATAFSPTDTMPMARWAKMTMLVQSGISLATLALVVARAVNVLK